MSKLHLPPDSSTYTVERGQEVLSVKLDGGASKFRRDIIGAAFSVTATWITDAEGYDYLNAFFRTETENGSLPFTIDLILDTSEMKEYTARFMPTGIRLESQQGLSYVVSAVLEVEPAEDQDANDATIISDYLTKYGLE